MEERDALRLSLGRPGVVSLPSVPQFLPETT